MSDDGRFTENNQAALKHGIYRFRDNGSKALDQPDRSRLQEIESQLQSREGVKSMLQERAANSVLLVELATSYIAEQHRAGIPLDEIAVFRALPGFMNSCHRQVKDLLDVIPDESKVLDLAEHVQKAMGNNGNS